ncbi:hypothetical protein D3C81_2069480 [compost metagenome]
MKIGGHRGHARNAEIEIRYRFADFFEEWQHKPSQTSIHMERDVIVNSDSCHIFNRVHNAMRIGGSRTNKENRIGVNQLSCHGYISPILLC